MNETMTINDIINQLGSLRASSAEFAKSDPENEIWKTDVTACETAIRILAALSGEGCTDLETTLDSCRTTIPWQSSTRPSTGSTRPQGSPPTKTASGIAPPATAASKSTIHTATAAARRSGGVEWVGAHLFRPLTA